MGEKINKNKKSAPTLSAGQGGGIPFTLFDLEVEVPLAQTYLFRLCVTKIPTHSHPHPKNSVSSGSFKIVYLGPDYMRDFGHGSGGRKQTNFG